MNGPTTSIDHHMSQLMADLQSIRDQNLVSSPVPQEEPPVENPAQAPLPTPGPPIGPPGQPAGQQKTASDTQQIELEFPPLPGPPIGQPPPHPSQPQQSTEDEPEDILDDSDAAKDTSAAKNSATRAQIPGLPDESKKQRKKRVQREKKAREKALETEKSKHVEEQTTSKPTAPNDSSMDDGSQQLFSPTPTEGGKDAFSILMQHSRDISIREKERKEQLSVSQIGGSFIFDSYQGTQLQAQAETFSLNPSVRPQTFASEYAAHVQRVLTPARTSTPRSHSLPRMHTSVVSATQVAARLLTPKRLRSPGEEDPEQAAKTIRHTVSPYQPGGPQGDADSDESGPATGAPSPATWRADPAISGPGVETEQVLDPPGGDQFIL